METFINAMMATLISFLTCIAPVAAMENIKHIINCKGEAFGQPVELVGEFNDDYSQGAFAISDSFGFHLYTDVEVTGPNQRYVLSMVTQEIFSGYSLNMVNYAEQDNAFITKNGTRISYRMTCKGDFESPVDDDPLCTPAGCHNW